MSRYHIHRGKLPIGVIFLIGLLMGILMMSFGKSILLENTGLMDEYTLYHMKYMTVDSSALFYYVLRVRMKTAVTLAILSTTYLGLIICAGTVLWYGMSAGAFLTALVIRYGLKGIFLAFAGIMPQYCLYVPIFVILLVWCEKVNRSIYFKSNSMEEMDKSVSWIKRFVQLAMILCGVFSGCLLESFANPVLLAKFLKIF